MGSFRVGFDRSTWREMLSYGLPFVPHHLQAVALALFGQYMVREMLGFDEAGLFNMASKFAMPVVFVVTAVQNSWVAYKFQIHAEDEDPKAFFRSTFTYYVAAITYLWVGVSLWGPEMVRLMTTSGFHPAALLVWAVSLVPLAQGIYFMSGTGMELSDNTRPFPLISLAGLVTVVAGAYLVDSDDRRPGSRPGDRAGLDRDERRNVLLRSTPIRHRIRLGHDRLLCSPGVGMRGGRYHVAKRIDS